MYEWMSYAAAHAFEAEAERCGVSTVARSKDGFMREYEQAKTAHAMRTRALPSGVQGGTTWEQKRNGFVARHLKSYREHPTYRRYLALIMWAYKPFPPPGRTHSCTPRSRTSRHTRRRRARCARRAPHASARLRAGLEMSARTPPNSKHLARMRGSCSAV